MSIFKCKNQDETHQDFLEEKQARQRVSKHHSQNMFCRLFHKKYIETKANANIAVLHRVPGPTIGHGEH